MGICKGMNEWKGKSNQRGPGIIKSIVALFDQVAFAPATDFNWGQLRRAHIVCM